MLRGAQPPRPGQDLLHPPDLLWALPLWGGPLDLPDTASQTLLLLLSVRDPTAALCFFLPLQLEAAVASNASPQPLEMNFPLPPGTKCELLEVHKALGKRLLMPILTSCASAAGGVQQLPLSLGFCTHSLAQCLAASLPASAGSCGAEQYHPHQ